MFVYQNTTFFLRLFSFQLSENCGSLTSYRTLECVMRNILIFDVVSIVSSGGFKQFLSVYRHLFIPCLFLFQVLIHLHKKMKNISKKSERSKRKVLFFLHLFFLLFLLPVCT